MIERGRDHPGDRHLRDPSRNHKRVADAIFQYVIVSRIARATPGAISVCIPASTTPQIELTEFGGAERQIEIRNRGARSLSATSSSRNLRLRLRKRFTLQSGIKLRNPRRNPADRKGRNAGNLSPPKLLPRDRMDTLAQQPGQLLLGHPVTLREGGRTAILETHQTSTDPGTWRAARLGVIPSQSDYSYRGRRRRQRLSAAGTRSPYRTTSPGSS